MTDHEAADKSDEEVFPIGDSKLQEHETDYLDIALLI